MEKLKEEMKPFVENALDACPEESRHYMKCFGALDCLKFLDEDELKSKENAINKILDDLKITKKDIERQGPTGVTILHNIAVWSQDVV